jgi:hypothetical protein
VGGGGADTDLRGFRLAVHGAHGLDEGGQDGDHLCGHTDAMANKEMTARVQLEHKNENPSISHGGADGPMEVTLVKSNLPIFPFPFPKPLLYLGTLCPLVQLMG